MADSHRLGLDGLRGLGFAFVITAHVPSVALFRALQGWSAVWIFLAMSGYLVTMLLLREEGRAGRIAFAPFLVKRFFRIVPSYLAAVLIYGLACVVFSAFADDTASFMARLP
jgi:peptidoglycan/LPS O-acetylase OafA/YrhL